MPPFESPWEYFSLFFVYLLSVWRLSSIHGVWVSGKKRRIHANKGFIEFEPLHGQEMMQGIGIIKGAEALKLPRGGVFGQKEAFACQGVSF
jgi:hypothetical protein